MNQHQQIEAVELLRRAAGSLQDYCAELNGDMNDSLAEKIEDFLAEIERGES